MYQTCSLVTEKETSVSAKERKGERGRERERETDRAAATLVLRYNKIHTT